MSRMMADGTSTLRHYSDRKVVLEVTGLCRRNVMATSNYRIKVPRKIKGFRSFVSQAG
ncbi:MAG: hypothetical protein F6J98_10810 [Moorea sp. SIO4G2]|uniref:hypothetical protein n=1 Tax=Moorena TaxID=1155738 RepID=UPI0013016D27|nr:MULTISPECIES: hypothetical protein [Moorena]NEO11770.1 hypothetical protein [Moorena sp. SIO3E8]NEO60900.1 hypothetical protein [Moorena sp. SIO4G2]NEP98329.1 hypothetical protein [Moorena sp. SIO3F7]